MAGAAVGTEMVAHTVVTAFRTTAQDPPSRSLTRFCGGVVGGESQDKRYNIPPQKNNKPYGQHIVFGSGP